MDIINHTGYSSLLFRTGLENDQFAAAIMVRVLYDITSNGTEPAKMQTWPLSVEPWESEYGPMESDNIFRKNGVDILVFGSAKTPKGQPVRKMVVTVTIPGKLLHTIQVFGNRRWEKTVFGLTISEPEPFTEMALNLKNAYGGNATWDGLSIPYGNNAFGKGYCWDKEDAIGKPLPNLENPEKLILKWSDRPDPVGVSNCPINELRIRNNVRFNEKGKLKHFGAGYFNTAFPDMVVKDIVPGDRIKLDGMSANGPWMFEVPAHTLKARIQLGEKIIDRSLSIDQLGLIPEKGQAFITYRYPFRYKFSAMQKRVCEIINDSGNGIN